MFYGILFDKDGSPIDDVLEWANKNQDYEYKKVAKTTLSDGHFISTVWTGIDYDFLGEGKPLIFESMVFSKQGEPLSRFHYSTLTEAQAGHDKLVKEWSRYL